VLEVRRQAGPSPRNSGIWKVLGGAFTISPSCAIGAVDSFHDPLQLTTQHDPELGEVGGVCDTKVMDCGFSPVGPFSLKYVIL